MAFSFVIIISVIILYNLKLSSDYQNFLVIINLKSQHYGYNWFKIKNNNKIVLNMKGNNSIDKIKELYYDDTQTVISFDNQNDHISNYMIYHKIKSNEFII